MTNAPETMAIRHGAAPVFALGEANVLSVMAIAINLKRLF